MKKTPLIRRTRLKRGGRLRYKTPARARSDRKMNPIEWEWLEGFDRCAICELKKIIAPHHMVAGPNRWRAKGVLADLLPACWECNSGVLEDETKYPLSRQCFIKLSIDPEHFDLDEINRLKAPEGHPRPPQAVRMDDVLQWKGQHK